MKKILIVAVLLLSTSVIFLFSQDQMKKISVPNIKNSILFSEIFKGIQYVPLETNKLCYLTYPVQLELFGSYIVIQDHQSDQVYLFSSDGKFIAPIGRTGKGPGELIAYGDYWIDQEKNKIEIIDEATAQLLSFDFTGKYIEKKKLIWCTSFGKTNSNEYLMYSGYAPHFHDEKGRILDTPIVSVSMAGEVIDKFHGEFKPFALGVRAVMFKDALTNFGDTVLFTPNRSNIVYQYIDKKLSPRVCFDFGKFQLPTKYSTIEGLTFDELSVLETKYIVDICQYYENNHYICFNFSFDGLHQVIISKENNKVFASKSANFINDIDGIQFKYFHIMGSSKDYLYYYIHALDFKNQVSEILKQPNLAEKGKYILDHPEIIKLNNSISTDDNFIVVKIKCL